MHGKSKAGVPVKNGVAKVPVVMQMEALECGAACLTMILAYYGKWLPLEKVRADCGVSRDGSNARNLLRAARAYGMSAAGYRMEPEDLKHEGVFPCIIHWEFNHFVVLDGFKNGKAVLNDPAKGRYMVSMERFDESFTGVCLMMQPTAEFVPGGEPKRILTFAKEKLGGTGAAFALVVATTMAASLIDLFKPGFARVFTDRLLTNENPEWLVPFIAALSALAIMEIIVVWINSVYSYKVNGKIAIVANSQFMWHVLRLPVEFFSQRLAGDIAQRKEQNASIAETLIYTFAPLVFEGVMLVVYLVAILRYSLLLSLIGIASICINLALSLYISSKRVNLTRVSMRDAGKLSSATVSGIEMIESIKSSGAENGYFERWSGYQASVNAQTVKYTKLNTYWGILASAVTSLSSMFIFGAGIWLVMSGEWSVGMVAAFIGFLDAFNAPATRFLGATQTLQEMRTGMERIEDVMKYPADVEYRDAASKAGAADETGAAADDTVYSKLSGRVELRHVTFGYSRLDAPLIEDFSMTLEPGERVAFVGASGCGKSTLSKLISGLYKPWSGEIQFDGVPIESIDRRVLTGSLCVVDQEVTLFEDTIANNIKMWDSSIEDFEMILAARDAQIHNDIMQRAGGYSGRLAEGGRDLSGGQRQRIEIARVLTQDPTIIILDEATSALDAQTEYDVVHSIADRGISCIVIAHRLSTVRDCTSIIVLDHGRVVEQGTHDELMARQGVYAGLVTNE